MSILFTEWKTLYFAPPNTQNANLLSQLPFTYRDVSVQRTKIIHDLDERNDEEYWKRRIGEHLSESSGEEEICLPPDLPLTSTIEEFKYKPKFTHLETTIDSSVWNLIQSFVYSQKISDKTSNLRILFGFTGLEVILDWRKLQFYSQFTQPHYNSTQDAITLA